jgi:hypothetical protein
MSKDEIILSILKDNNPEELKRVLEEQIIHLNYMNKRGRNLIELACMYSSSECLAFLIEQKQFFIDPNILIPFILTKGEDNSDSLNTLAVFFSKKPELIQSYIPDFSFSSSPDYFIEQGYLKYYKITIQNDPNFGIEYLTEIMGKYYDANRWSSSNQEKIELLAQFVSVVIHELADQGMFVPLNMINNLKSYEKVFEKDLNYYELNIEKFMLEVSFSSEAQKSIQKENIQPKKKKI